MSYQPPTLFAAITDESDLAQERGGGEGGIRTLDTPFEGILP